MMGSLLHCLRRPFGAAPAAALAALLSGLAPATAVAQGAGSTGATVLQLLAGGRAAAFSGAYTAATGDVDVVFYNPAGLATLDAAGALSYQRHVLEIGVATAAGAHRFGAVVVGVGAVFLDGGSIDVIEPDPDHGGQVGRPTGATTSASELAARVAIAMLLSDDRLHVGAGAGLVTTSIAEATQSAPVFDLGAQWRQAQVMIGASLRNLGGQLTGSDLAAADLPTEARAGVMARLPTAASVAVSAGADVVRRVHEQRTGFALGVEAGLPTGAGPQGFGAVARVGYNGVEGRDAIGALQLGAGLSWGDFALDYAFQNYEYFGALHRFGVRWARLQ